MWARFHRRDIPVILHYIGLLVIVLAALELVPLATALIFGEWEAAVRYFFSAGLTFAFGMALRITVTGDCSMDKRQAVAITVLIWVVFALLGAVPLALSGHYCSYFDAVFDSISSLTDTGLSLINDLDHMANADDTWRFAMQFIGGQGVVLIALSLGIFTKAGSSLYSAEGRDESIVPNIKSTARFIWRVSGVMVLFGTVILMFICLFLGFKPLDAFFNGLWITIGAYDTGGLAPHALSLMYYHSWPFEIVTMMLMLFGATNFILYAQIGKGFWRQVVKDIEVRTLALWMLGMLALFVLAMMGGNFLTDVSGLVRRGVFTVISAATSTGFTVLSTNQMATLMTSGALFVIAIAMAIGGSSGSTVGGIKAMRIGIIAKSVALKVKAFLLPSSALVRTDYYHINRRKLSPELMMSAMVVSILYVISFVIGSFVGIACGYDGLASAFESISAAANNGLSTGITAVGMPPVLELTYMLQMWLGRLEFLSVLAIITGFIASFKRRRNNPLAPVHRRRAEKAALPQNSDQPAGMR
ncbi:MAG: hypothetical protein LBL67_05460 [Coriobacteriales bacterium]|jgi:trk system potassium uptake protein TrkH|nr:hypothetical protein [Coriobacteriales bacterium]